MVIEYGNAESPFGKCYIAVTDMGVCGLIFGNEDITIILKKRWGEAEFRVNNEKIAAIAHKIFTTSEPVPTDLRGTPLQIEVWQALQRIPAGTTATYSDIAKMVGRPKATRAIASAIGSNDVSYIIPCHRVLRKDGSIGGYRWGIDYKKAILEWEKSNSKYPANIKK